MRKARDEEEEEEEEDTFRRTPPPYLLVAMGYSALPNRLLFLWRLKSPVCLDMLRMQLVLRPIDDGKKDADTH